MKPMASWCAFFVFNSAWQLLLLTAVAAILVRVPAKLPNRLQYQIWVSCLLLGVAVPGVSTYLGFVPAHPATRAQHIPDDLRWKVAREPDHSRLTLHLTEVQTANTSWPLCEVIAGLYGLSVLIGLGRLLRRLETTRQIVAQRKPYESKENVLDTFREVRGASVPTFRGRGLSGPATVSWPRPMILLPPTFDEMTSNQQAAVLAHEEAHVQRHDFFTNVALEASSTFLCYHPMTSWLKRRIGECREVMCDELAADATFGRTEYARCLLGVVQMAQEAHRADVMLGVSETGLERRIMKLVDAPVAMNGLRRSLLHAGCLLTLSAAGFGVLSLSLHPASVQAAGTPAFLFDPSQTFDTMTSPLKRKPAPDFTLVDNNGKTIRLSAYKGKVVLLDFWATWCGGCKLEIPWYMEFDRTYRKQGLAVIGVSMDDKGWAVVKPFLEKKRDDETGGMIAMQYPVVIGNDALGSRFGLTSMPMTLLIDKEGKIALSHTGVVDKGDFENHIRQLLQE